MEAGPHPWPRRAYSRPSARWTEQHGRPGPVPSICEEVICMSDLTVQPEGDEAVDAVEASEETATDESAE